MGFTAGSKSNGAAKGTDDTALMVAALNSGTDLVLSAGTPEPGDEGEWITPNEGMELKNVVVERAFMVTGQGQIRPAYAFRDTDGATKDNPKGPLYLISEKTFMKPLRALNLGVRISLEFTNKVSKGNFDKWIGNLTAHAPNGTGPNIFKTLEMEHRKVTSGIMRDFNISEDAPF